MTNGENQPRWTFGQALRVIGLAHILAGRPLLVRVDGFHLVDISRCIHKSLSSLVLQIVDLRRMDLYGLINLLEFV